MGCCVFPNIKCVKVIASITIFLSVIHLVAAVLEIAICYDLWKAEEDVIKYVDVSPETEIIAICSVILDVLWIIACIVLLTILHNPTSTSPPIGAYVIWVFIASAETILDLTAIIIYGIKAAESNGSSEHLVAVGIASRGGVFFIVNVAFLIDMIIETMKLSSDLKPKKRTIPLKPPKSVLKKPKPTYLEGDNIPRVQEWYKNYENSQNTSDPDIIPYSTNPPRMNPNYNYYKPDRSTPSDTSSNENRGLVSPSKSTNIMVNGVPSGTLRRQLPWSYMSQNNGLLKKKKTPPPPPPRPPRVPAPDYDTQKENRQRRQEFQSPGWSQYF